MTTKKESNKKELSTNEKVGIGVGLTAAAVAAAGAYFLYGSKSAAKNRRTVRSWMLKAKAEVLEQLENAKEMSREEYEELIATVAGTYAEYKDTKKVDVKAFVEEMTDHWKKIEKEAKPKKKKITKKTTKKVTTKKVSSKSEKAKKSE